MVEAGHTAPQNAASVRAIDVSPLNPRLFDAVTRLVGLLDAPNEAPVLQSLITREITYRLMRGEQADRLRHIAVLNGQRHRMAEATGQLHDHFDESIRIESLAEEFGMSESSFYDHFKAVSNMSPVQFQKQLRLQEARRLMLSHDLNASTANYRAGYEDPSHFSRDYKQRFGDP